MCFSAASSFTASAVLVPVGIYCVFKASTKDRRFLAFAFFPLVFGVQQFVEGFVWHFLASGAELGAYAAARTFLFFSHFVWLVLSPLAVFMLEPDLRKKRTFKLTAVAGAIFGAYIYLPILLSDNTLNVVVVKGSVFYETFLLFHEHVSKHVPRAIYALIILAPFLLSSLRFLRVFGLLLLAATVVTILLFEYAFISVWCFFAAILSIYVLIVPEREIKNGLSSP